MSLDFGSLANVGGNLNVQNLDDSSYVSRNISFPLLETIGGYFYVYRFYGDNLIAPSLTTIGDYLNIYQCYYVTDISLPALQTIGSYFQLYSANELRHANFQSLLTIGSYFYMYSSSSLRVLEFPVLDTVGNYFRIYSSGVSTGRISLPLLRLINGDLSLSSTTYQHFDAPMLKHVAEDLDVSSSYNLVEFNTPRLSQIDSSRKKSRASHFI